MASADSHLAGEKEISIERLLQEPLYLTEKGISYRYALEQSLAARGYELHPVWEVGNTDVINPGFFRWEKIKGNFFFAGICGGRLYQRREAGSIRYRVPRNCDVESVGISPE